MSKYKQHTYPSHNEVDEYHHLRHKPPCFGKLKFIGEKEYNLEIVPDCYVFVCKICGHRLSCDGAEASKYVEGIIVQEKLKL